MRYLLTVLIDIAILSKKLSTKGGYEPAEGASQQ
jgi:hypothetical protein